MSLRSNRHHRFRGLSKKSKVKKSRDWNFSEKSGSEAKGFRSSLEFTLRKRLIAIFVNGSEVCTELCDFLAIVWQEKNLCKDIVRFAWFYTIHMTYEYLHIMHVWKLSVLPWSCAGLTCLLWVCGFIHVGLGWILEYHIRLGAIPHNWSSVLLFWNFWTQLNESWSRPQSQSRCVGPPIDLLLWRENSQPSKSLPQHSLIHLPGNRNSYETATKTI